MKGKKSYGVLDIYIYIYAIASKWTQTPEIYASKILFCILYVLNYKKNRYNNKR